MECSSNNCKLQKPPQGTYKCNVDAGFHGEARKTSAGWCVRDHIGQFVLGGSSWIQGSCSTNEGETLAMLEAMKELHQRYKSPGPHLRVHGSIPTECKNSTIVGG
ncbi:cytochrome p450 [Trifolium pratense]|uniref:Cytochrome p450 n=1 Tax=Trifolium pratense TaxID=57577 RepID=A0A2K3NS02_TRIPR|nr:cytochrome p450 [Trifolium pratense]